MRIFPVSSNSSIDADSFLGFFIVFVVFAFFVESFVLPTASVPFGVFRDGLLRGEGDVPFG